MALSLIFPGQGSQAVGMGRSLSDAFPSAKTVFEEVDEALGENLTRVMWDGPIETLTLTKNAQPALMACSLGAMRVLESEVGFSLEDACRSVAGHSLGEYSALAAAGSLSIADTARLLRIRGEAMQAAVPVGQGAMAAILGLDIEAIESIAAEAAGDEICAAANDNAPGQVVVSGNAAAIDRAIALAKEQGAKRALPLPVSAPFHCALMAPAADVMAEALANVSIKPPLVPLFSNVKAGPISDPEEIRTKLVEQVTGAVRWRESIQAMFADGTTTFLEVGTGKVLSGLVKRIDRAATVLNFGEATDLNSVNVALGNG
ncbi:MAG: ACP S-malonyltransferase [Pseudomonadota bacterium]